MSRLSIIKRALVSRLPAAVVPSLAAGVALWADEVELHLLDVLADRRWNSVDVGANMGVFSKLLIPVSRDVHAVEAHPRLAAGLREALGDRITVHECGLSDRAGTAQLRVPVDSGSEIDTRGSLEADVNPEYAQKVVDIELRTIDSLGLSEVRFIKIDVEGHEQKVLDGGRDTIREQRPNLLVEAEDRHRAGATAELFAWAEAIDYRGVFVNDGQVLSVRDFDPAVHQVATEAKAPGQARNRRYVNNFIFVPASRAEHMYMRLVDQLTRLGKRQRLLASLGALR